MRVVVSAATAVLLTCQGFNGFFLSFALPAVVEVACVFCWLSSSARKVIGWLTGWCLHVVKYGSIALHLPEGRKEERRI
jgi:hypothetical protein